MRFCLDAPSLLPAQEDHSDVWRAAVPQLLPPWPPPDHSWGSTGRRNTSLPPGASHLAPSLVHLLSTERGPGLLSHQKLVLPDPV